jgi:cytochrome c biogenesis protein ResB
MFSEKKASVILIHISFVIIVLGYCFTFLTGIKGSVHLREGETANSFLTQENKTQSLPFSIRLKSFEIEYFNGTNAAKNYKSEVEIQEGETQHAKTISLNAILSFRYYRFYQTSFDKDEKGSWFTVKYDPLGIFFTYLGYSLFGVSMLWMLILSFRKLMK